MTQIDTSPGSLDGPPVEEKLTIGDLVGRAIGVGIVLVAIAFLATAMVWAIAWMITHFPG